MSGVCLVIAVILGVLVIGLLRAKRKNWALAVLPLGFVPMATGSVLFVAEKLFQYEYTFLLPMVLIVVSLMLSCIWVGVSSAILIKTKKMRTVYLGVSFVYVFVLSLILLIRYYFLLLPQ